MSHNKIGDVQVAQGDLPGGLISYHDGLAIVDRLAKSDPANAESQRYFAVSQAKIGLTLAKQGTPQEGAKMLQRGHAIMVRLTALSPDNAGWKLDLNWFEAQIAELSH